MDNSNSKLSSATEGGICPGVYGGGAPVGDDSKLNSVTFDNVCQHLSKLSGKKPAQQKDAIHEWFSKTPRQVLYTILKFLLPTYDARVYKIKHFTLAKLLAKTFNLSKSDAYVLANWNKPNQYQISNNFGLLAYNICKKRTNIEKNDITIQQIDTWLTLLTEDTNFISTILSQLNAVQLLWFCNIVLKQVKIGTILVLRAYHPDAPAYWNTNRNLEDLCTTLVDYKKRYDVNKITWGHNFSPMLCESMTYDKLDFGKQNVKNNVSKSVYVETKWDGERLMLHYRSCSEESRKARSGSEDDLDNDEYICYTRNGKNYTNYYKSLQPYFKTALANFDDCIVDGEIVLIDKKTGKIAPKANMFNGTNKLDYDMRYIIFDIVYVNGESIAMLPLNKRMNHLAKIVCNDFVTLSDMKLCSSRQDVLTLFTRAIETREEGIVIKYEDSSYEVGSRKKTLWIKMKQDYEDAIADDLDLVIIGGYYAEGSSTEKQITSFLVGYLDKKSGQFKSITSVGNGFTDGMYTNLYKKLCEPIKFSTMTAKMLNLVLGQHTPDVLYNPMKSIIVQIRAANVIESDSTGSKMNLRFPRCMCIRYDKKPTETTIPMLSSLKEKRVTIKDEKEKPIWEDCAWWQKPLVDKTELIELDQLFKGMSFFISVDKPEQKQELEKLILEHGGTVHQSGHGCTIVSEKVLSVYTQKDRIVKLGNKKVELKEHNIVKPKWIEECIEHGEIRAFNDENCTHSRENLFLQGSTFYFDKGTPSINNPNGLSGIELLVKSHGANIVMNPTQADNIVTRNPDTFKGIVAKFHTPEWVDAQLVKYQYNTKVEPTKVVKQNYSRYTVFIDSDLDMKVWRPRLEKLGCKIATTFDAPITHVLISQKPTGITFDKGENKIELYDQLRLKRPKFQYLLTKDF